MKYNGSDISDNEDLADVLGNVRYNDDDATGIDGDGDDEGGDGQVGGDLLQ